jgi:hypothetical protein
MLEVFRIKAFTYPAEHSLLGCNALVYREPDVSEEHVASILTKSKPSKKPTEMKHQAFSGLHGITTQKIIIFIATTMRTSNPTFIFLYCPNSESLLH